MFNKYIVNLFEEAEFDRATKGYVYVDIKKTVVVEAIDKTDAVNVALYENKGLKTNEMFVELA